MGTIRLRNIPQEGKDTDIANMTVRDSQGYKWHLQANEAKVLPDNADRTTLASNATVKWGTTTQQAVSPDIKADVDDQAGRT